jgi:glyoxylase-like metal-dependent hydrolase (beta-lactamase superfamily II)
MRVEEIAGDILLFRGERYDSGTLAVFDEDRALLVDGMASAQDARNLREALVGRHRKRVSILVSTHYFSDHLAAWNLFPEADVVAHEKALATFRAEQFRSSEEEAHFRPPTVLLSGRLEIAWGRHRVEVFENPGHTPGTLNVDVPEADLLHVGDTAVGRIAYLWYSVPEAIDRALARALARGRRRIVRSHGPAAGPETLEAARTYLRNLGLLVLDARRRGRPLETIRADDCLPPGETATSFELFFHARNLASIESRGLFADGGSYGSEAAPAGTTAPAG